LKLPRDVSGDEIIQKLSRFNYVPTRQTGSHIRLTSFLKNKEHSVTIPRHSPLKVGTLNSILSEVSGYLEIEKSDLINKLFG